MQNSCKQVTRDNLVEPSWWRTVRSYFVFHLLRRYPAWAGWLPAHTPRLTPAGQDFPAPAGPWPRCRTGEPAGQNRVSA
jgi:cardiolipin synthase